MCEYLYLSSDDRTSIKGIGDFTVQLPNSICKYGIWVCGLMEFEYKGLMVNNGTMTKNIVIGADICQDSIISSTRLGVLRKVRYYHEESRLELRSFSFDPVFYVTTSRVPINSVRIFILDENMREVTLQSGMVNCTLHLKRVS